MDVWLKIAGIAVLAAGLAGLFIPVLPGSVLLFAGVFLIAWADGFERIGIGNSAELRGCFEKVAW